MTHTDAKRALQIVALSSARIEILAGCDCRNPQVQILGAQPALLAVPRGGINLAQCEIDAYCPKKGPCILFGTRGSQVQILPLHPAYQALSSPRKNRAQEIAQETGREAERSAAEYLS
jgi:hypothetical protein